MQNQEHYLNFTVEEANEVKETPLSPRLKAGSESPEPDKNHLKTQLAMNSIILRHHGK